MGRVDPFQLSWSRGMKRDLPRDNMPSGAAWNLVDYIPDILGAPLVKRGGWSYQSNNIASTVGTASYIIGGAYAPFAAGGKNCAIDEDGNLVTVATNGTVSNVGAFRTPCAPLAFHRDLLIGTDDDGTTAPRKYDGSAIAALGGSPPAGKYGAVYKDRTVLAGVAATPNRVFFSGAGDPETWDTTNSWIDMSYPVTGLASTRNALLVFSDAGVERIIGSTPPPGSDMSLQFLFSQGCLDARSILVHDDFCVFANTQGVFLTDGAAIVDLAADGGMKKYWVDLLAGYSSTWTIAAGHDRDFYIVALNDGTTFKDAFLIHQDSRSFLRASNFKFTSFWRSVGVAPELYGGYRGGAYVADMTSLWAPAAAVKNDADGTAVAPVLETPWIRQGASKARLRRVYLNYDVRDAASDNPTLTVSYIKSPELTSYTAVADLAAAADPLDESSEYTKARRFLNTLGHGIAFKVAQTNASSDTRLYALEIERSAREATRIAA